MVKVWDCDVCKLCSSQSKGLYYFDEDLKKSINAVEEVANDITTNTNLVPYPTDVEKRGDILIKNMTGENVARVEVKLITTTFKMVKRLLPQSNLSPFEVVVIDEPKLQSYFKTQEEDKLPYFVVIKLTRACRNGQKVYARLEDLKKIYNFYGNKRFFKRRTGFGDGTKGVITKYHFSVDREFNTDYSQLFNELNNLN